MIYLTPDAIKEVNRLGKQRQQDMSHTRLRVGIQPGCCSDFSYSLDFDSSMDDHDLAIDSNGITLILNRDHTDLLNDLTIDYSEDLMGGAFRFLNPNATHTSNCGNSFSVSVVET